jgi:hypothetical protein
MAWSNPNPSVKQERNQPSSYPSGSQSRHQQDYADTKAWYADRAADAHARPGEHRTPSSSRPGG